MEDAVRATVGPALGAIPSGLFICSCGEGATSVPFVASFVQQVAMDPPAVCVSFEASRAGLRAVDEQNGAFTLSILPAGRDDLMRPFFGGSSVDPFRGLATQGAPGGGRFLAESLAWLECREIERAPCGGHVLVIGQVLAGARLRQGKPRIHLRRNGFTY